MLNTPVFSMVLVLIASVLGAVGQFLFQGAARRSGGIFSVLTSPSALLGMTCYVTIMVLFTHAFKLGGTVRVLYPLYASTFVWAAVMALIFYSQPIRPIHIVGMALLITGMAMMSW